MSCLSKWCCGPTVQVTITFEGINCSCCSSVDSMVYVNTKHTAEPFDQKKGGNKRRAQERSINHLAALIDQSFRRKAEENYYSTASIPSGRDLIVSYIEDHPENQDQCSFDFVLGVLESANSLKIPMSYRKWLWSWFT